MSDDITALLERADAWVAAKATGHDLVAGLASALREREAALQRAREELDALLAALRKVRGHTSYVDPTMELLAGLLQSIERITDAALASRDGGTDGP